MNEKPIGEEIDRLHQEALDRDREIRRMQASDRITHGDSMSDQFYSNEIDMEQKERVEAEKIAVIGHIETACFQLINKYRKNMNENIFIPDEEKEKHFYLSLENKNEPEAQIYIVSIKVEDGKRPPNVPAREEEIPSLIIVIERDAELDEFGGQGTIEEKLFLYDDKGILEVVDHDLHGLEGEDVRDEQTDRIEPERHLNAMAESMKNVEMEEKFETNRSEASLEKLKEFLKTIDGCELKEGK